MTPVPERLVKCVWLLALAAALPAETTGSQPEDACPFTPGEPLSSVIVEYEIGPSHRNSLINRPTKLFLKYKENIERYPRSRRFYHRKAELFRHIETAFRIGGNRIIGPDWISNTVYEVYFETTEPTCDFRLMLRQMVAEQFRLTAHVELKPNFGLVLTTPGGEPNLKPSRSTECVAVNSSSYRPPEDVPGADSQSTTYSAGGSNVAGGWFGIPRSIFREGCRMADLAGELERVLGVPVADRTSATGRYDFKIVLHRGMKMKAAAKQLRKKFGAELATDTEPSEVLVIDSVKRIKQVRWSR
jgi:uncharacterized protein (TIGR03435 family)